MKYNNRNNPNKNIKVAKITILFIIISILVITVGNIVMQRFSNNTKTVQALDGNQNAKSESSDNQSKSETDSDELKSESNSEVENSAFVEKYLNQQMKGQRPRWS